MKEVYLAVDKNFNNKELLNHISTLKKDEDDIKTFTNKVINHLSEFGFNDHDSFNNFDKANSFCNTMFGEDGHVLHVTSESLKGFIKANFFSKKLAK